MVLSLIAVVVVVAVTFVGRSAKSPLCSVGGGLSGGLTGYSKAVLADCPVAYWRMGESAGTIAADSSGNNHRGVYNGAVTLGQLGATSDRDTAVALDGLTGYMSATVPASTSVTVEVWVKSVLATWNAPGVISTARVPNGWILYPAMNTTYMEVFVQPVGALWTWACTTDPAQIIPALDITTWHQYALTYDGATASGYIDGVRRCSGSLTLARSNVGEVQVLFGKDDYLPGRFLGGTLDEASIYSNALTGAQVAAHFKAATG